MPQYLVAVYHPDDYDPSLETEATIEAIHALNREMIAAGARKFACGISPAGSAKSVRAQPDGKVLVTDGPYTETKEHMGGFWILEAANVDEASPGRARVPLPAGRRERCGSFFSTRTRRDQRNSLAELAQAPTQRRRKRRRSVKYLCFGYYDKGKFDGMTESERNAMFDSCFEYDDHLRAGGHWVGGEALQGPETALTLDRKSGRLAMTDGPYAETKEQLGGLLILEARDMNHAAQLIGQHPALAYGNTFEIRPAGDMSDVMEASAQRRRQVVAP